MKTYSSFAELHGNQLQRGDHVIFDYEGGNAGDIPFVVEYRVTSQDSDRTYLTRHGNNYVIFEKLGLNKLAFCKQHYGYVPNNFGRNAFPETNPNDFAALTRVTLALFDLIETPQKLAETSEILFID